MTETTNWAEDRLNELDHHGVKGMKWGVRKDEYRERKATKQKLNERNERYSDRSRKGDSRGAEKRINRRMNMNPKMGPQAARNREQHRNVKKFTGGLKGGVAGAAVGAVVAQASISTVVNATFSRKGEAFLTRNLGPESASGVAYGVAAMASSPAGRKMIRLGGAQVGAILGTGSGTALAAKRFDKKERQQYEEKNKK